MAKYFKVDYKNALRVHIANMIGDYEAFEKFNMPITEKILQKNGWVECTMKWNENESSNGWTPTLPQVYDEKLGDWVEQNEDIEDVFIWYETSKECWCYKYAFGTYVYDVKSIGELEIIMAREGFQYIFEV